MKFALFYEIPVARPWAPDSEHIAYKNTLEQAIAGEAGRVPRVLDGRAPLPRGVLALLEPRGAVRRDREPHVEDAARLRRAPHAQAVQPSRAHRRVGRGARPAVATAGSTWAPAARRRGIELEGFGIDPQGHARDVARGDRARRRLLDQRAHVVRGQALVAARPARAAEAVAAAAPADLGRDDERRRPRAGRRARPRPVLVRGRRVARRREEEDRHLPRVGREVHDADRQVRQQPGRDVHDGVVRADRGRSARDRRGSRSSGTRRSAPARSRRSRSGWRSASRRSATTTTRPT